MSNEPLKIVNSRAEKEGITTFGDILSAISSEKKLNQLNLSIRLSCSQPTLSRICNNERPLSPKLAEDLSKVLGGSAEEWLEVYTETKEGSDLPIISFRDRLLGGKLIDDLLGTRIRRMQHDDIVQLFRTENKGEMTFRGSVEECEISCFDEKRVKGTSYDTCVGSYAPAQESTDDDTIEFVEVVDTLTIPAKTVLQVRIKEFISLPHWLEADLHPASNISNKNLIVSHGPIIDPGWKGSLCVSVYNPTIWDRAISVEEPFLTLKFWMQDSTV